MEEGPIDAGDVDSWLEGFLGALAGNGDADVPCGTCTACCASSQFVLVEPTDTGALAAIPSDLLVPAPGLPKGFRVMGYDDRGRCPMLGDSGCTIYDARPRTCRTYDCRVFPATGVAVELSKPRIAERAARWRFRQGSEARAADVRDGASPRAVTEVGATGTSAAAVGRAGVDRVDAARAAAAFLADHPELWPPEIGAPPPTQMAVIALEIHEAFLGPEPTVARVRAALDDRPSRSAR